MESSTKEDAYTPFVFHIPQNHPKGLELLFKNAKPIVGDKILFEVTEIVEESHENIMICSIKEYRAHE